MSESDVSDAAGLNRFDATSTQQHSRESDRLTQCLESETLSAPHVLTRVNVADFTALLGVVGFDLLI